MTNTFKIGIYLITVLGVDGLASFYVGKSVNLRKRQQEHFKCLRKGRHPNSHLQRAWDRYGESAFQFSILEGSSRDQLVEREQATLDRFRQTYGDRRILNILKTCVSTRVGVRHSLETRHALSVRQKTKWSDPTFRSAMQAALNSPEAKAKIAAINALPESRMKRRMASLAAHASPGYREKQRSAQISAQNRPSTKERKSLSIRRALASPEVRIKRKLADLLPEVQARRSAAARAWRV